MIDFDQLVLNKCEDIFSIAIRVVYAASAPEMPAAIGRGIFSSAALDVAMQDDTIFSDQQTSLGIRLLDFAIVPDRGDIIEFVDIRHRASFGKAYWIGDLDEDGQGGATLLLRKKEPS